ncbi:MAG: PorP/SprF family type IX secretion system membrane protein [Flavobacteriaceae bacterium]|nr:PorP/SprF family type IX secretion system membrane protein [Flavobacteriaceae bacterium]
MRRISLIIFLSISFTLAGLGQNLPQFDNYFTNKLFYNPAFTGIENFTEIQALYRSQWKTIDESPKTFVLALHAPTGNSAQQFGFSQTKVGRESPYRIRLPYNRHSGIGTSIYVDRIGPFRRWEITPSYAMHLPLTEETQLSLGLGLNISNTSLIDNDLTPTMSGDPLIDGFQNQSSISVKTGILLSGFNGHIGVSLDNHSQLIAFGSRKLFDLHYGVELWGLATYRRNEIGATSWDAGVNISWQAKVYSGIVRRDNNELLFLGGFNWRQNTMGFNFLYNFGVGRQNLSQGRNHSMEFSLIMRLTKQGFLPCFGTGAF